jgi:hypothetical protein
VTNLNDILKPSRVGYLLRLEALRGWRNIIIISGSFLVVSLFLSVIIGYFGGTFDHEGTFSTLLFIGGIIYTSRVFSSFYKREWNVSTLMLPASLLEKWLTQLLLSTLGWVVFSLTTYLLFSLASWGLNTLLWHSSYPLFLPGAGTGELILSYLVSQSLFFLGSAVFRKAAFFKTLLSTVGILVVLGLLMFLFMRILFWEETSALFREGESYWMTINLDESRYKGMVEIWEVLGKIFYYGLLPLFCWLTALVRLREVEVHHGV